PSGHLEGYIALRWINADHYPKPDCLQVKTGQLEAHLPQGMKTITKAQRKKQLAARRAGVLKRFPY
ncbi:MAG: hypothetical protein R3228_15430, partial [Halioglobus sp.]|nr:hypothetical protein [Halioglobus sp.]